MKLLVSFLTQSSTLKKQAVCSSLSPVDLPGVTSRKIYIVTAVRTSNPTLTNFFVLSRFRIDYRRVWIGERIFLTTYTHHLSTISTLHKSSQHPLSLFPPVMSSRAVSCQRLLIVQILQISALRSSLSQPPV
jgi:hypothetical protein